MGDERRGDAPGGDPVTGRRRGPRSAVAITVVIVLTAAFLRSPFVAVAPVAREIGADLRVDAAVVGLLTSIPVLCFAVFAPVAIQTVRRMGPDAALTITLLGATVGCLIRPLGSLPLALVGTAVMGLFLTIGNVVIPILIGREYDRRRAHTMTGVYTSALNLGTVSVTLLTAPLAQATDWRWAITVWAGFAIAALAVWLPLRGLRAAFAPAGAARPDGAERIALWRHRPSLLLAVAFAGQGFAFYGMTAWLPSLLSDAGYPQTAAGAIASIFQVCGIAGSLLLPQLTVRTSAVTGVVVTAAAWLTVPVGFIVAPSLWVVWCIVGGLAQGAGLTVVFILINALGGDEHEVAGRSGLVQGVGYGVASIAPIGLGAIHQAAGSWTPALVLVAVSLVVLAVAGSAAARHADRGRRGDRPGRV